MKRIIYFLMTLLFITISPLLSYGAEMQQQAAAPAASQHKDQNDKTMEERLRELGKQLDELKVKVAAITEQARKDVNHQLEEADKKELEELRKKSEKEWKKFTTEMNKAADDLQKAFEHAKSRVKE